MLTKLLQAHKPEKYVDKLTVTQALMVVVYTARELWGA